MKTTDLLGATAMMIGDDYLREPVAWIRQTDITELTDSEPETDGWTPLCACPQPSTNEGGREPDWRELLRRCYVELFSCDQQMTGTYNEEGEPMWTTGSTVRDILRDAKSALEAHPAQSAPLNEGCSEPVAWVEHHKGGDNLVWDDPGGNRSPLYARQQPAINEGGKGEGVAWPCPTVIERTHPNRAYVTLGFGSDEECTRFIKATRHGSRGAPAPSASPAAPTVTDGMVYAFHGAIGDGAIGTDEFEELRKGIQAALTASPAPTQPSTGALTDEQTRAQLESLARHPYGGRFAVYMSG